MPQLERELVKARATRLRAAAAERRSRWLDSLVGTEQRVLVENGGKGHTDGFAPVAVAVAVEGGERGDVVTVRITARESDHLSAVWA